MRYEWDSSKEKINIKKHGVSFEDAKQALNCGLVVVLKEDSASGEERYVYLGMCKKIECFGCCRRVSRRRNNKNYFGSQSQ
jgi:uncharacterized DUF497 family protein